MAKNVNKASVGGFAQRITKQAAGIMAWVLAPKSVAARIVRLQMLVANDNHQPISAHLVEQLLDIMAFTAKQRGTSFDVMMVSLCLAFNVGSIARLRDVQFRPALNYVLMYNASMAG